MTVTPRGVSMSGGVAGARISAHSSGRVTRSLSVPGTGLSHVSTSSGSRRARSRSAAAAVPPPRAASTSAAKPGLLAPKWEKALHKALSSPDAATLQRVGAEHPQAAPAAAMLVAVAVALPADNATRARELLGWVLTTGYDPSLDPFMQKYAGLSYVSVGIAEGIIATLPLDRDVLGLSLAELHQEAGDLHAAVDVVEGLEPTTLTAVSLAELYGELGRWQDVVDLTNGVTNEDEASVYLLVQRGAALRELGHHDAACEALKEALRLKSRPVELLHMAYVERAATYVVQGKAGMARRDLEHVMAANSSYPGLSEALAALPAA